MKEYYENLIFEDFSYGELVFLKMAVDDFLENTSASDGSPFKKSYKFLSNKIDYKIKNS